MTLIDLIRHGQTPSNKENRFRGGLDMNLDERGAQQAERLKTLLSSQPYAALYTSPLSRAVQTLQPLADSLNLTLQPLEALTNIRLPLWEGKTVEEVARRWPDELKQWQQAPETMDLGGQETLADAGLRAQKCLLDLCRRHEGQHFALCSHRSVLKPLLALLLGMKAPWFWKIELSNGSVTRLSYDASQGFTLLWSNFTPEAFPFAGSPRHSS